MSTLVEIRYKKIERGWFYNVVHQETGAIHTDSRTRGPFSSETAAAEAVDRQYPAHAFRTIEHTCVPLNY